MENKDEMDVQNVDIAMLDEILVKAMVQILKPDEGIVIHHDKKSYIVYWNSVESSLRIVQDEDYAEMEHGRLIWMHYEGSQAPEPGFGEEVFCDPDSKTRH